LAHATFPNLGIPAGADDHLSHSVAGEPTSMNGTKPTDPVRKSNAISGTSQPVESNRHSRSCSA
jgi:hypothetical protein